RRLGARVEEAQPEGFDLRQHHEDYLMLLNVIAFAHLKEERAYVVKSLQESSDPFAEAQLVGVTATVAQFMDMLEQRERYRSRFRAFFRAFDLLLTPVTITPAFPHINDQIPMLKRTLQVNGGAIPYTCLSVYVGIASYSGLPATAFPWGRTRAGLPIGLQAIGPYLEDRTTLAFASLLEREFGGFASPPDYS
ncbi:MAG TPA: amidase family protein, partial [Ktedonobacteraceae bacterium]|nr:amidase family protein [Ktedonobacteraceae bacterium]